MSYDYELDGNDQEQGGPKALREALDKANKALEAANAMIAKQGTELSEIKLGQVFNEKAVPAALQRLMKAEKVEPSAEAVDKWLADNGSDFGWKPGGAAETAEGQESAPQEAPPAEVQSVLTPEDVAAQQRLQSVAAGSNSQTQTSDQIEAAVAAVESSLPANADYSQVVAALKAQGIPIESAFKS